MLASLLHSGVPAIVWTLLLAGLIIYVVFFVLPLPPVVRTVLAVVIAVVLVLMLLGGCANVTQARKDFLDSTDVSVSAGYDGVTVTDTITNGRRHIGVGVDGKQVVKALRQ